jgi:hypothetical protein
MMTQMASHHDDDSDSTTGTGGEQDGFESESRGGTTQARAPQGSAPNLKSESDSKSLSES